MSQNYFDMVVRTKSAKN